MQLEASMGSLCHTSVALIEYFEKPTANRPFTSAFCGAFERCSEVKVIVECLLKCGAKSIAHAVARM